jgi:hypothetical protein
LHARKRSKDREKIAGEKDGRIKKKERKLSGKTEDIKCREEQRKVE